MNFLKKQIKDQKGASIIETLVALAFIAIVSSSFINLAIVARKISFRNRVQNDLGRYAGMIAEEVVKDYTLEGNSIISSNRYCITNVNSEVGALVEGFLETFDSYTCTFPTIAEGNYQIKLTVDVFGKTLEAKRFVILK